MSDQTPQTADAPQQPPAVPTYYVDSAEASGTNYTINILFAQLVPDGKGAFPRMATLRLQMGPHFAKVLGHLLSEHVKAYEAKVGPLPEPEKIMYPDGRPKP